MSDPPRLRDAGADAFTRGLLREAPPTRAFTAADAARLQAAAQAAAGSGSWLATSALPKALAAVALVAAGTVALRATPGAPPAPAPVTRAHPQAPAPAALAARVAAPPAAAPRPARAARAAPAVTTPVAAPPLAAVGPVAPPPRVAPAAPRPALASPLPAPRPGLASPPAAAPPTLHDELLAIEEAQAALRADPARAVEILARAERSAVRPQLLDERDLLHVEALARLGRWDEARARALALEARAPRSPQSARARALLRRAP